MENHSLSDGDPKKRGWRPWLATRWLKLLLALSLLINGVLGFELIADSLRPSLSLLHPGFDDDDRQHSVLYRRSFRANHAPLSETLANALHGQRSDSFSVYFETLNSGGWIGIREREKLSPGSLRKLPLVASVFKLAERGELNLDRIVKIEKRHLDVNRGPMLTYGPLGSRGTGHEYSIRELTEYVTRDSDNTAANVLFEIVGPENYTDAMFAMGMSVHTLIENFNRRDIDDYPASAYEFAQIYRSLYFSGYLLPRDSQKMLRMLSNSAFRDGIPAGAPGIAVAHKTGDWAANHHDCGIVYAPENPYVLCIMTQGLTKHAATQLIERISAETFAYVQRITPDRRLRRSN